MFNSVKKGCRSKASVNVRKTARYYHWRQHPGVCCSSKRSGTSAKVICHCICTRYYLHITSEPDKLNYSLALWKQSFFKNVCIYMESLFPYFYLIHKLPVEYSFQLWVWNFCVCVCCCLLVCLGFLMFFHGGSLCSCLVFFFLLEY